MHCGLADLATLVSSSLCAAMAARSPRWRFVEVKQVSTISAEISNNRLRKSDPAPVGTHKALLRLLEHVISGMNGHQFALSS
jgi:hypothetical protein